MTKDVSPTEALFRRMSFLVVDGSTGRADTIERYLLLTGAHMVRKAPSPLPALRILQDARLRTDCIICQQEMEPMSGVEFLTGLRAGRYGGRPLSETAFVLLTRRPLGPLENFKHLRLDGLISGGVDRDQFCEAVFKALAAHAPSAPSAHEPLTLQPTDAVTHGLKVAHVREQGVDLVIVPLDGAFGREAPERQAEIVEDLRRSAAAAHLNGEVVPVWDMGDGRMGFIAPVSYHPYFRSITLEIVRANLNREIACEPASAASHRRSA